MAVASGSSSCQALLTSRGFHWQVAASPAGLLYSSCCPYLPPLQYKAAEERERLQDKSQSWSEPDEREE